ncbi:thiopeptide-type bacteriocin biosynthesis protein [Streptomyces sp. NPDC058294]|uniref:thiopeptide-type bacteriocin biosynthesis protein n=1 Tax=Streptomyces sp. NPDC058294 TaxID=3346430 RepID=UPI0036E104E6
MSTIGAASREPVSATWTAWHLHLASTASSTHDRVLLEVVAPAVRLCPGHRWFFIRYWHKGPHLRLRIADLAERQVADVEDLLRVQLTVAGRLREDEEPLSTELFTREAERLAAAGELGRPLAGAADAAPLPPGVHRAVYEPEYERYGVGDLMALSEDLFTLSSGLALAFLTRSPDRRARAALALRATAAALHALPSSQRLDFCAQAMASWRAWLLRLGHRPQEIEQATARAGDLTTLPEQTQLRLAQYLEAPEPAGPLAAWAQALADAAGVWERAPRLAPGRVLFSHVHMLHNRLGLGVLDELATHGRLSAALSADPTQARITA